MKKAILFDFGGTLDTNGVHWYIKFKDVFAGMNVPDKIFREAYLYNENQIPLYAKDIERYDGLITKQIQIQIAFLESSDINLIKNLLEKRIKKLIQDVNTCLSESISIIRNLKENYKIGIVSNFYGNLEKICGNAGLNKFVDVYVDSAIEGVEKPDKRIFETALNKIGCTGADAYMVGDSYDRDIVPSKETGCTTIWLKNKSWKEEFNTEKSDFTINNLNQLLKIIKNGKLRK